MPDDPFAIHLTARGVPRPLGRAAAPLIEHLLGLRTCGRLYRRAQAEGGARFELAALRVLGIEPRWAPEDLDLIPRAGPLVIVCNHPHGALDGLLALEFAREVRDDVRLLANHVLARVPELRAVSFFVDPFGGRGATARSCGGMRAARAWLDNGGALIVFPAGEVAHTRVNEPRAAHAGDAPEHAVKARYADTRWHPSAARLAIATDARVMPIHITGANRPLFYAAGRVHARLRTALLARELLAKGGTRVTLSAGLAVSARDVAPEAPSAERVTTRLRTQADAMARWTTATGAAATTWSAVLNDEIASLPDSACVLRSGRFAVYCTPAHAIPSTLREIGRLREATFRAVGEGTGRSLDLDVFDGRYLHLFSWDVERRQVAGAYRLGRTDEILDRHGVEGLYTRTLFRYDRQFIERLAPAVELGRSFVRVEYQRDVNALSLLWQGIGRFLVRHPRYRILFGPVSISTRYSDRSHGMLAAFLQQNHLDEGLADLVQAINPRPPSPTDRAIPASIGDVDRLLSGIEGDGKRMPVLLRHYLKLNARLIGFNVDPDFGGALDALMMVDLAEVDPVVLRRYLGPEASRTRLHVRPAVGTAAERGGVTAEAAACHSSP